MSKKKRVLFITNEYPVLASPTSLAASMVINNPKYDYEVFCLSIRNIKRDNTAEGICTFNLSEKGGKIKSQNKTKLRISQFLTIPIYPVLHPYLQMILNRKSYEICLEQKIDIVISVSFPFESVIAGAYVKKRLPDIIFIPYLIDAFSCGTPPKYLPVNYSNKKRLKYEYKAIRNGDGIIAMESGRKFYEKQVYKCYHRFKYLNPAFFVGPKHCFSKCIENEDNELIKVVYSGYLYLPDRDPTYAIRLLSSIEKYKFSLSFIGRNEANDIIETKRATFNGEILTPGFMKHEELEEVLANADFLLHLGVSNGRAISGKIFEYMSYGKPIIALYYDPNEATIPYLEKYPYAICINTSSTQMEDAVIALQKFITENIGKIADRESIEKLFYSSTPGAFWDVIHEIVEDNKK